MSDYEVRRLELKSQMLSSEISRIERSGREISYNLKKQEQNNLVAQKSWLKYLKDTVSAYKSAPQELQRQILKNKLQTLSDSKKVLVAKKKDELKLRNRLNELLFASKQKEVQLNNCGNKKKLKLAAKSNLQEQIASDDFVAVKSAMNKNRSLILSIAKSKPSKFTDTEELTEKNDANKIASKEQSSLEPAIVESQKMDSPLPSQVEVKVLDTNANLINHFQPDVKSSPNQTQNENQPQSSNQERWQDAKDSQTIISQQNEKVRVSLLQTSQGDAVCVDYLLAPGRMFSVGGSKLNNSSAISLNLNATTSSDRGNLKTNKQEFLSELKNKGHQISDLKVDGQ